MAKVVARAKIKGKNFEIHVNLEEALKVREGKGDIASAIDTLKVFSDIKKGIVAGNKELVDAFGTNDFYEIAKQIIMKGEVQKTQDFRDAEKEARINQVVQLIVKNAVDQHGRPYTEDRIKRAIEEAHCNLDNRPAEQQISDVLHRLKDIIPIKVETKKIRLTIPAQYSGQVYGLLKDFKESEEWLSDGKLVAVLNIPAGMQTDFYEKLNAITHGAAQSEEMK